MNQAASTLKVIPGNEHDLDCFASKLNLHDKFTLKHYWKYTNKKVDREGNPSAVLVVCHCPYTRGASVYSILLQDYVLWATFTDPAAIRKTLNQRFSMGWLGIIIPKNEFRVFGQMIYSVAPANSVPPSTDDLDEIESIEPEVLVKRKRGRPRKLVA